MKKLSVLIIGLAILASCRNEYKADKKDNREVENIMSLDTTKDSVDRRDSLEEYEARIDYDQK